MREIKDNIWSYLNEVDVICITTNGIVKKNGSAVMGRGVAREAKIRYPKLPELLAERIKTNGNVTNRLFLVGKKTYLVSFPTKHDWKDNSDLDLIEKSCEELVRMCDYFGWKTIVIPRPGCGNGQRDWENEVAPILRRYLDERFLIVYK